MVRRNIEHEARLIDDLLDTSRYMNGKLHMDESSVDCMPIERAFESSATRSRPRDRADHRARRDRASHSRRGLRLRQVMWNLVNNARRHTPRVASSPSLVQRAPRPAEASPCATPARESAGDARRMFEFDEGAARAGLGLGLAVAKGIVEAHDGASRHSDGPERGTTIEIELDTVRHPAARATAARTGRRRRGFASCWWRTSRQRGLALRLLGLYGHRSAGRVVHQALRIAARTFDLLITDIGLPDGDGLALRAGSARAGSGAARSAASVGAGRGALPGSRVRLPPDQAGGDGPAAGHDRAPFRSILVGHGDAAA